MGAKAGKEINPALVARADEGDDAAE
jgi:hypothetical protein